MATIKSYTDLSQSKKLAEILPLESADMYYFLDPTPVGNIYIPSLIIIEKHLKSRMPEYDKGDIPAWSFVGLLKLLPKSAQLEKGNVTELYRVTLPVELESSNWYIDPIDACYELILKLHELKML